jgi:WD40 repeat protein
VWDAANGKLILKLSEHDDWIHGAYFSPDGKRIVTACRNGSVKIWDAASGKMLTEVTEHKSSVFSAIFCPNSKRIVTAGEDKTARVWGYELWCPFENLREGMSQIRQLSQEEYATSVRGK